jgi:hypothetical protein
MNPVFWRPEQGLGGIGGYQLVELVAAGRLSIALVEPTREPVTELAR